MRTDSSPDGSAWAAFRTPDFPTIAEHNPASVHWGDLRVDPDLVGLAIDRARPTVVEVGDREHDDLWALPVPGVLETRLAWHPNRPLVAGLTQLAAGVRLWVADYRTRTVEIREDVRAATSLTSMSYPVRGPVVWVDESRLAVLTLPDQPPAGPDPPPVRPAVYEATGPGFVAFEPDLVRLAELCGVTLSMVDLDRGSTTSLTRRLLVRGLDVSGREVVVEHLDEATTEGSTLAELRWSAMLVDRNGRTRPTSVASRSRRPPPQGRPRPDPPERVVEIPTGWDNARLAVWDGRSEPGAQLLWIRVRRPGTAAPVTRASELAGCAGATLDLPLHWPADATLEMLRTQIDRAIRGSVDALDDHRGIIVGGHSFGATIALHALANFPELTGCIAHSGCYNRTLTPTGFQYEHRPYWKVPDIYHAFSALLFADRIDRPVLIVHGTDDVNPSTTPEQAVHLYQGIVANGGQARLLLLPYEGHSIRYRENREALFEEHRAWLAHCGRALVPDGM